jgi:hypothetical protein
MYRDTFAKETVAVIFTKKTVGSCSNHSTIKDCEALGFAVCHQINLLAGVFSMKQGFAFDKNTHFRVNRKRDHGLTRFEELRLRSTATVVRV